MCETLAGLFRESVAVATKLMSILAPTSFRLERTLVR